MLFDELSNAVGRLSLANPGAELAGVFKHTPAGRGNPGVTAGRVLKETVHLQKICILN